MFYAAGIFIALSGVLAWLTGVLEDLDEAKEQEQGDSQDNIEENVDNMNNCSNERK